MAQAARQWAGKAWPDRSMDFSTRWPQDPQHYRPQERHAQLHQRVKQADGSGNDSRVLIADDRP